MSIYTVHEPPLREGDVAPDPERAVFVRDGFYFWAFVFGPIWMLWRRLWIVFVLYLIATACIGILLTALKVGGGAQVAIAFLLALLTGFEAGTLRRWTLLRRGWTEAGSVVGDDLESAERRFFSARDGRSELAPVARPSIPLTRPVRGPEPDVLGLFPEPGGPR